MTTRLATLGARHLDDVVALEAFARDRPWSVRTFAEELVRDDRCYVGAWEGDRLVGFGGLHIGPDEADVLTLVVAPEQRRRGIGRLLVERLADEAVTRGATSLILEVAATNHAAEALYRSVGFTDVGRRPGYYPDGGDAVMLCHCLAARAPVLQRRVARAAGNVTRM
ncbi:MAG: ribosomal protein S18-alanine N-acetyltransferase [Actinobacteria bacterium]|nr:ribosomal protein S18-alanine N-acetyltransferase [Actinomycetota bacterium]